MHSRGKNLNMLISDSHKFAFIHIPKCAGTTVRKSLLKFDTRNNFYWMHNTLEGFGLQGEKTTIDFDKSHLTLNVLKYYYEDDFKLLNEYTTFAFSRNPVTRLVSCFFCTRPNLVNQDIKLIRSTFESYVDSLSDLNFFDARFVHSTPQSKYHIHNNKNMVDVVIKLEEPEEGLLKLGCFNKELRDTVEKSLNRKENAKTSKIHELELWENLPPRLKLKFIDQYIDDFNLFGYPRPDSGYP